MTTPTRGEVWWCEFDPTRGSEIQKTRPAVVISSPTFNSMPIRIVVPLTSWQPKFATQLNKIYVRATASNGLSNDSAADFLQVRAVSLQRLTNLVGPLDASVVDDIAAGIAIAIDYRP